MKKILFLILFLPIHILAQDYSNILEVLPISDGNVTYSSVTSLPNQNKAKIYSAIRKWAFNLPKYVVASESEVTLEDKEDGVIVIQQKMFVPDYDNPQYTECYATQTINIQVKNERYKYIIDNIEIEYANKQFPDIGSELPINSFLDISSTRLEANKQLLYFFDKKINDMLQSLTIEIPKFIKEEDDW